MKHNYKYNLDTSSRKFICPNCNKKTLVEFIYNETQQYLNINDGRCDRESKCRYFKKPSNNFSVTNSNNSISDVIQPIYHSKEIVIQNCDTLLQSSFIMYLLEVFSIASVTKAIKTYNIGITNY